MSKLNQIENILLETEGGLFQKVCDAYICKKESRRITSTGSQDGTNKTVKGTPDSYIIKENGNYIFIEYSTQRTDLLSKIKKDIEKCFDEKETGIPLDRIDKIIYCHIDKLATNDSYELVNMCKSHRCLYDDIDVGSLSFELAYNYPQIASDLLGVSISTRQILSTESFISYRSKTIPLNNKFYFREKELTEIIDSLINNDITVITGKSGTGKTRVALEAMKLFLDKNKDYNLLCIENKGIPIYNDFLIMHGPHDKTLLLVDDANRLSQLSFILSAIIENNQDRQLKIILTVRDYGLKDIDALFTSYKYQKISINNFTRDQISKILLSESIGITNPIAIERICLVSKGNARLAIMASNVVLKTNDLNSISDSYKIYDQFFENLTKILDGNENKQIKKVLGIISYFHVIDKNSLPENIYNKFNISEGDFWDCVLQLYSYELVDLFESQVCKISDQVLAAYYFYKTVFFEKVLEFNTFLINYFLPLFQKRMIEAIIPVAQTFNFDIIYNAIIKSVKEYWLFLNENKQYDYLYDFANVFWFIIPNEVLNYLNSVIENIEEETTELNFISNAHGITDKIYQLLRKYTGMHEDEIKVSIQIACKYFIKRNDLAHQFSDYLQIAFGFDRARSYYTANLQSILFNVLFEEANKNQLIHKIIMFVSPQFLKMSHENTYSENMTFTITQFGLVFDKHIETLHSKILSYIKNQDLEDIIPFIKSYLNHFNFNPNVSENELRKAISFDSSFILDMINHYFDWKLFSPCKIANDYINFLEIHEVHTDIIDAVKKKANTKAYNICESLSYDRHERKALRDEGLTYSEIEEKHKNELFNKFKDSSFEEYIILIETVHEILQSKLIRDEYQFRNSLSKVFENLIESKELFLRVMEYLTANGNKIDLDFSSIPYNYFKQYPDEHKNLFYLLNKYEYKKKHHWIYTFFYALPDRNIDEYYSNELMKFIDTIIVDWNFSFDLFVKYNNYKKGIFIHIIRTLYNNRETNKCSFSLMLNSYSEVYKMINELFTGDKSLLEQIWLNEIQKDPDVDYDGQVLKLSLKDNPNFIIKYLNQVYSVNKYISEHSHNIDFEFIWGMDSYADIIEIVIDYIIQKAEFILDNNYLNVFFGVTNNKEDNSEVIKKQKDFIYNFILIHSNDVDLVNLILSPIKKYFWDELENYILLFLSKNKNIESFEKLRLEYDFYSGDGSFLPVYNKMLNLWESLKSKLDSLVYIDIRQFIIQKISYWRYKIAEEEKRNFIGYI